jgi:hypothetical protein
MTTSSPHLPPSSPPPIAALFLVVFDHRKGYVLQWHQSTPASLQVEGVVEFKCLPSGLHRVNEDVVYFTHTDPKDGREYVGVAAYVNKPDGAAERGASMLSVGVLVQLEHGRMGKAWLHVESLRGLARRQIDDVKSTEGLERYWDENVLHDQGAAVKPEESTDSLGKVGGENGYSKHRSMSTTSELVPGAHTLAPHHPAATLIEMLEVFGPLLFPLYRAALLRKRILLVTEAPAELACNVVYNLSVLSSLPPQLLRELPRARGSNRRIRSLFSVGVQDIDTLSNPAPDGWIACTTDDVLATKPELYDLAVYLPGRDAKQAKEKVWPKIVHSSKDVAKQFPKDGVRASQRDGTRYEALVNALRRYPKSKIDPEPEPPFQPETEPDHVPNPTAEAEARAREPSDIASDDDINIGDSIRPTIEPASWSQVAYISLLWWASAGDRRNGLTEEEEEQRDRDTGLLDADDEEDLTKEVLVVGYFRRLTGMMFQAISDVLRTENEEDENAVEEDGDERGNNNMDGGEDAVKQQQPEHAVEHHQTHSFDQGSDIHRPLIQRDDSAGQPHDEEDAVEFSPEDVSAVGLDVWSKNDNEFVEEVVSKWYGRRAVVRGGVVECCGMRIL